MHAITRLWASSVLALLLTAPGLAQPSDLATSSQSGDEALVTPPSGATPASPPSVLPEQTPPIGPEKPAETAATVPESGTGAEPASTEEHSDLLVFFLSILAVGVLLFVAERLRGWMTSNLPVQRILGALVLVLRLVGVGLLLAIVLELVPAGQDWILGTLLVLALVVGWSVRDLFADAVAGAILAAERRVKKGVWVSGDGFEGTVEGRSLRATWLRDGQGHRLTVPNRHMVGAPMAYDTGADAEHEVVVRLEGYEDAGKVRMALTDAILSSPWVLAGSAPVVLRDPADPVVWRVRAKLLEPRFSYHFEGELLERVEDLLRYHPEPEERETVPSEAPLKS